MTTAVSALKPSFSGRNVLFSAYCVVLILFALQPLRRLVALSLNLGNSDLSYILLIPFISAALMYWDRERVFAHPKTSVLPGALVFVLGGVLYAAGWLSTSRLNEIDLL